VPKQQQQQQQQQPQPANPSSEIRHLAHTPVSFASSEDKGCRQAMEDVCVAEPDARGSKDSPLRCARVAERPTADAPAAVMPHMAWEINAHLNPLWFIAMQCLLPLVLTSHGENASLSSLRAPLFPAQRPRPQPSGSPFSRCLMATAAGTAPLMQRSTSTRQCLRRAWWRQRCDPFWREWTAVDWLGPATGLLMESAGAGSHAHQGYVH
jgi:hypothetical protein